MGFTYYASRLTENIGETPEGYLICRDAVIGRTGFQTYEVRELPPDAAALGVDMSNPAARIELYRSMDEVFSPATLASFEGKSVTDDHPPDAQFVDPTNIEEFEYGHVQNVRKGETPLDTGDWPMLADLIIKRQPLIDKVKKGQRELSCGYDYALTRVADRVCQSSIRGNHVAVVLRGRAGAEARIKDSAPPPQTVVAEERDSAGSGSTGSMRKETPKVTNILKHLLGLGLKAYAADADAEKVAEAVQAIKEGEKPPAPVPPEKPGEKPADDKPGKPADDKHGDDRRTDDQRGEDYRKRRADDCRSRLRDRISRCDDADLEELEGLLEEFFEEEGDETQHGGGVEDPLPADDELAPVAEDIEAFTDPGGGVHPIRGSSGYKRSSAGEGRRRRRRANDEFIEPVDETPAEPVSDSQLKALRAAVARSGDADVRKAFNSFLAGKTRSSRASTASYSGFAGATRRRAADAPASRGEDHKDLQSAYDNIYAGGRKGDK